MPRAICEFCRERVPQNRLALHKKHCPKARLKLKRSKKINSNVPPQEVVTLESNVQLPITVDNKTDQEKKYVRRGRNVNKA